MDPTAAREWRDFIREERAAIQKLDDEKDLAFLEQQRREADPDRLEDDEAYIDQLRRQ